MRKANEDRKAIFVVFTRADNGLKEAVDVLRIKEIREQADGTTFLFTKYEIKTGEISGHAVTESFESVMNILAARAEVEIRGN